jgi:hypothetical protein
VVENPREKPVVYAMGRRPNRTYLSASFRLRLAPSRDYGQWARYIVKVFDEPAEWTERDESSSDLEWTEEQVVESQAGRKQVTFQVARQAGEVRQIKIEAVRMWDGEPKLVSILRLDREGSRRLIDLVETVKHAPVEGGETTRIDDQTLREFFADPDAVAQLYERDPVRFRELIRSDASADDVVALAHRRRVVQRFRELLTDADAFDAALAETGTGRREDVWQRFLEKNPWILGVSLAAQLLTSWDPQKLEQVVRGPSVTGPGKRVDALLETSGRIRSLVFAEIKHHETPLLAGTEYRSGSWAASADLAGAVTQAQRTVDMAVTEIGERLPYTDEEGAETGEAAQVVRPRSFVIAGQLDQLRGPGGVHVAKFRSFELFRRNLHEPEIVTYDELLARAEWHVEMAEREDAAAG